MADNERERRRPRKANVALDATDYISAELVNQMDTIDANNRTNPYARGDDLNVDSIELNLIPNQAVNVRTQYGGKGKPRTFSELTPGVSKTGLSRDRSSVSIPIVEIDDSMDSILLGDGKNNGRQVSKMPLNHQNRGAGKSFNARFANASPLQNGSQQKSQKNFDSAKKFANVPMNGTKSTVNSQSINLSEHDNNAKQMKGQKGLKRAPTFLKRKSVVARKSMMFKAINAVSTKGEVTMGASNIMELQNEDMDGFMDEQGQTIRWQRMSQSLDPVYAKGKCFGRGERIYSDTEAVDLITQINEELYERLEARRKAISNWKRLKIVIVILKMSGGRVDDTGQDDKPGKEETKTQTCDEWFSKFIITPFSRYIILWNIIMTMVYLLAIIMDTLIVGFHLRLLLIPEFNIWQMVFSAVMFIDIVLKFFIAIRHTQSEEEKEDDNEDEIAIKASKVAAEAKQDDEEDGDEVVMNKRQKLQQEMLEREEALKQKKEEDRQNRRKREIERLNAPWFDPEFEKRFTRISRKYCGQFFIGYFMFDCLACVPVLIYEAADGFSTDEEVKLRHIETTQYRVFWGFKLFKFLMLARILQSLAFIENLLKDRYVERSFTVENIMGYVRAAGEFIIMIHLFSCAWLFVGQMDGQYFHKRPGEYSGMQDQYVDAIYFVTTTMTSVGYGDIYGFDEGRICMGTVMFTQFFGMLGFSIVKQQVFSSKNLTTNAELVAQTEADVEETLFRIDQLRDGILPHDMYDAAIASMGVQQEYSICNSFANHGFWQGLSPQLQQRLFESVLSNVYNRIEFFFYDYQYNVVPPKILIRKIVTELHAQMFKKDDLIVEKGQVLEDLMFIYVGVAHLFGYDEWNDETMRHKCITLKKGSWFGDYQILVGVPSEWDMIAGGDSEFNISKKPKGMPRDHILIYKIPSARLISILDKYPLFRSFIVTRSLIRRSYFMKVKNDNMQVILFEKKKEQHMNVVSALGIRNDFMAGEDSDDEHQDENRHHFATKGGTDIFQSLTMPMNSESALSLAIAPDENATSDELRQRKEKLTRYLSKSCTKKKLLRDAIKLFKRNMQRIVKNKRYDPLHLRNRIELQDYQDEIADLVYNESMNEAVFVGSASSTITQSYAEFQVRVNLVNLMAQETLYNWQRFLRTKDGWMGNIIPDDQGQFEYYKSHPLHMADFERQVLTIQQHRSQAHTENRQRELARSQYTDDKRLAVFKMVEKINLKTQLSTDFLQLLSVQIVKVETKELLDESKDIWENIKFEKDDNDRESDESDDEDQRNTMEAIGSSLSAFKTGQYRSPPKGDKEIMLFENEMDKITQNDRLR